MKKAYLLSLLSIMSLSSDLVTASNNSEESLEMPSMAPNKREGFIKNARALETEALNKARDAFSRALETENEEDVLKAYSHFKKAVDINGSPLGYLYLSVLENNVHSDRYLNIAFGAYNHDCIEKDVFENHLGFLESLGYLEVQTQ